MAPELVELGDRLEAAAARSLARRRARRQLALNAAASLIVAVPVTIGVATTQLTASAPAPPAITATPAPTAANATRAVIQLGSDDDATPARNDFLPRDLRRFRLKPQSELLLLPSSLRPALR